MSTHHRLLIPGIVLLVVLTFAVLAWAASMSNDAEPARSTAATTTASNEPSVVRVLAGSRELGSFALARFDADGRLDQNALRAAVRSRIPEAERVREGRATVTFDLDRDAGVRAAVSAAALGGGVVQVPRRVVSSTITAPILKQRLRNNCETAALSILLRTVGTSVDQLTLQRQLARSGPLDPTGSGAGMRWGDPDRGYVGRPAGGGVAGGFGVYPGPIAALARRHRVRLENLTGKTVEALYRRLRTGHAVLAWIGLGDGPYGRWTSPEGKAIKVNFNEHTVVLHGITRNGTISVSNPLKGTAERWTPRQFEAMWRLLGGRALATTGGIQG
ncbi:C39 family peptidase [Patulibacter sp. NPDC049589]|uniref:C39 family peptidase n=1 Tax=Patulibacter sp. NPDC049589 TaxID=3154731 RepID=UPI00341253F4